MRMVLKFSLCSFALRTAQLSTREETGARKKLLIGKRIMVKELYQTILRETSLNVTSGEIDSIRKKSITKSGCRVYDGSYLGVSGVLGEPTPEAWTQAEANLSRRIPCPWGPETGKRRTCRRGTAMDAGRFLQLAEELLGK